ncbi:MAG: molecular chaperone Hsp90 [Clostridiales bacterium]|nr:molecular chaperone Hsp90 [Clostridiales bacterium]MDY4171456.1 molecular chaperone Hsp90 [Evtepia sp.]
MEQTILDYVVEKTRALMAAETCSSEAKQAAQAWLDAVGTDREREETGTYLQELEEDVVTIDELIAFAESAAGKGVFGEGAAKVSQQARQAKQAGAKYCFCPACTAAAAILEKKDLLLK